LLFLTFPAHAEYQTPNAPLLGAAWYPEQWPESQWDHDLQLMQDAHMNVVRIGEFAWSSMEPTEGHYDLAWLDRAIALAAKHHLKVVLSTPTDAPPAWLTTHYPETLGTNADGHLREHGGRRQFNYASPRYRQLCAAIVQQLAQRYGHNPDILGWQIGNEYTDESFDPATRTQFQQFLQAKYKTLASLNDHWATAYWSQTYTDWSQIPMAATNGNPGLLLDHKHFVTATWRSFQRNQIDVLRPAILPTQFITTNIGGLAWSDNWDHYALTADLDLASWDDYVGRGHLQAPRNAMLNDFVRGWKRQNFWVMETQPGSVNWAPINNALAPGETRALAWQTIGHGADAVLYWQWRDALNGQEQYHGAIAGPDGNPLPIYAEIQQLGADLELTRAALAGTQPHSEVALLHDYDSRWAIDFQPHTREYDQQQILLRFYEPLQSLAGTVDIVEPNGNLDRYKLLVAPSLNVLSEATAAKLLAYVQHGGHLLLGPRSGMKDEFNSLHPIRQPGPLASALGGQVAQYYALDHPVAIKAIPMGPGSDVFLSGKAQIWAEALTSTSPETRIVLTYSDPGGWLDDKPAMLSHNYGEGTIDYLGTLPDPGYLNLLLEEAAADAGIESLSATPLPRGVERCTRASGEKTVTILINHNSKPASLHLPHAMRNLLQPAGSPTQTLDLPPQGIAVLEDTP
jgi:beta-galactosidase